MKSKTFDFYSDYIPLPNIYESIIIIYDTWSLSSSRLAFKPQIQDTISDLQNKWWCLIKNKLSSYWHILH